MNSRILKLRFLNAPYATDPNLNSPSTLVTLPRSMYEPSEATTLYDDDLLDDICSSTVKSDAGSGQRGDGHCSSKESSPSITTTSSRNLRKIWSCFIGFFTDYRTRKQLLAIGSRVEHCRRNYYPMSVKDLQTTYEYLHELECRRSKFANAASTLRLSILELLFDILDNPVIFSEERNDLFQKFWSNLDYESSRVGLKAETHEKITDLKHRFFLRVVSELPVNRPISEIIPNGSSAAVEALCKELAYGTGAYYVQKVLGQIAETNWGHRELLCLISQPCSKAVGSGLDVRTNLITDCITRLLSFKNGFSYGMAFRTFGRVAQYNQEAHALLTGSMGIAWLVDRLEERTNMNNLEYINFREGETYCHALMTACRNGFINCVLEYNVICTLLRWIEMFTLRGEAIYSAIEDSQRDDSDVELGQVACCEFIILLMATPTAKKRFLDNSCALRAYLDLPSHSFSSWKLRTKLKAIAKLLGD